MLTSALRVAGAAMGRAKVGGDEKRQFTVRHAPTPALGNAGAATERANAGGDERDSLSSVMP